MRRAAILFTFLFTIVGASSLEAQVPNPTREKQIEQMKALDFLMGHWQGQGWAAMGPGKRDTFKIDERVTSKAGGSVALLQGLGKSAEPGSEEMRVSHDALAVIWWDPATQDYAMQAWSLDGGTVETTPEIGENQIIWGFDANGGRVRFSLRLNDENQWHEVGEWSSDGKSWLQFLEMTLDRVED